ncbi:acrosin-like [Ammospiza nelsoni]|uniref:acrosin-like n=1 Tax=Ammospiza nelsoni TaxID=2857394 RepID=UPI00286A01AF|nr:acrosin-like [Ammospiza nelsoni]
MQACAGHVEHLRVSGPRPGEGACAALGAPWRGPARPPWPGRSSPNPTGRPQFLVDRLIPRGLTWCAAPHTLWGASAGAAASHGAGWKLLSTCRGSCGVRPLTSDEERGRTRVVGGKNAEVGAWPWLVSIQDPSVSGTGHLCGGSLISTRWVLTAAHCFAESRNISAMRLLIGVTQLTEPGPEAQVRLIKRLLIHNEYDPADQSNDIALLEMSEPVQCNSHIQLVCVPKATVNVAQLDTCYVAGWGATTARSQTSSDILQEAKVHLINVQICNSSEWYQGDVHSHNLCAGYPEGGIDTCQGDSGGPLMCKDKDADFFWVVGITSWGRGCARAKRPGIYTSVRHFYDWIALQMEMLPQSWNPYPTASPPWTRPTNAPWPTQKPWPTAPPAPNPWPTAPPPPKPWPTTMPTPKPSSLPTPVEENNNCPYPLKKLMEFFTEIQKLLKNLQGIPV